MADQPPGGEGVPLRGDAAGLVAATVGAAKGADAEALRSFYFFLFFLREGEFFFLHFRCSRELFERRFSSFLFERNEGSTKANGGAFAVPGAGSIARV